MLFSDLHWGKKMLPLKILDFFNNWTGKSVKSQHISELCSWKMLNSVLHETKKKKFSQNVWCQQSLNIVAYAVRSSSLDNATDFRQLWRKLLEMKKPRNIIFYTSRFPVWFSQISKILFIGNYKKKCFNEFGKWSIHGTRVSWMDHTVSINGL